MKDTLPVLLAEDDSVDQQAVQRAFKQLHITNPLVIANDGEEALSYLKDTANKKPCLILLDLKMPKMDGLELLGQLKADDCLRRIPVVVFTTSKEEGDKARSFDRSVAGYIVKPPTHEQFVDALRTSDLYWTLSELPPQEG